MSERGAKDPKPTFSVGSFAKAKVTTFGTFVLATSPRYTVRYQFEFAWVEGEAIPGGRASIGYFNLSGPWSAAISPDEAFVVVVGGTYTNCGFSCYRLGPPWRAFSESPVATEQWWCPGLNADFAPPPPVGPYAEGVKVFWHRVEALAGHRFMLIQRLPEFVVRDWVLDADSRTLTLQREYVDEQRKRREELLESMRGLRFTGIREDGDGVVLSWRTVFSRQKGRIRLGGVVRYDEHIPYESGVHATFNLSQAAERRSFVKAYAVPRWTKIGKPTVDELRGELNLQVVTGRRPAVANTFPDWATGNFGFTSKHRDGSGTWTIHTPKGDIESRDT